MLGIYLAVAFLLGLFAGVSVRARRKEITLTMSIQLDATQPVKVSVSGKDAEGNAIDLSGYELSLSAEGTNDKNFGEVNDENDTFNPGEAGATGRIKGSVSIDGTDYAAELEVELVAGGLTEIALDLAPVE